MSPLLALLRRTCTGGGVDSDQGRERARGGSRRRVLQRGLNLRALAPLVEGGDGDNLATTNHNIPTDSIRRPGGLGHGRSNETNAARRNRAAPPGVVHDALTVAHLRPRL